MFKKHYWMKILLYAWTFYLPQIFSISVWGVLLGSTGFFLMFIASSIGYTIRGIVFLVFPIILLKIALKSRFILTFEAIEYAKPLVVYGVISFFMRVINIIFPEFFTIRGVIEQILLFTALIVSYYKLGIIASHSFGRSRSVKMTGWIAGMITCLIFPPPF
ncbi:hypothetical protein [Pyrococcus abyssi]|uniref:Uncharacterized protein n=1 Tax=Pyrococcus abyssi (strain GE5 / Orsay) TaxID=272844 RepID=G8ZIS6_PYRAB|nr:hypothetical protein [Pyrococcus abyssi]CCE70959.1 TPA: hypothetical protein PAB0998.1n [Pyrococcus abyssi GE5]